MPASNTPQKPPQQPTYSWSARSPNTKLYYIRNLEQANTEVEKLTTGPIGFDLEWKPIFFKGARENPVAVVQIANHDTILVIQVTAMKAFPEKLREYLEREDIIKAGVGIQQDAQKLYHDWGVSVRSCVDLSLMARSVDNARWKGKYAQPIGLARLVETYEGMTLTKGRITRSNWESVLSLPQQEYAGNDAHAGLVLYQRFSDMLQNMTKAPDAECFKFDAMRGNLYFPSGLPWGPRNPDYDPGPPPPPKFPKIKKDKEGKPVKGASDDAGTSVISSSAELANENAQKPNQKTTRRTYSGWRPFGSAQSPSGVPVSPVHPSTNQQGAPASGPSRRRRGHDVVHQNPS